MTRRRREALGLILVLSLICGLQGHARADMSMDDLERKMAAGGRAATYAHDFVDGMEEGIRWANLEAKDRYGQYLYCQPDLALTDDQIISIVRQYVAKHPPPDRIRSRIGLILMNALIEVFPCPK
jgi:hypothetical protein